MRPVRLWPHHFFETLIFFLRVRGHVQLLVHVCIATKMSLSKYFQAKLPTPSVAEKPHQPLSFKFPKREFGKKSVVKRSFQPQWFARWKWLHYDEERDLAFCFTCVKAYKENKLHSSANLETAYISTGYSNWKDASVRIAAHEASTGVTKMPY